MLIQTEVVADRIGQYGAGLGAVQVKHLPAQAKGDKGPLGIIVYHADQVTREAARVKQLFDQVLVGQVYDIAKLPAEQVG